MVSENVLNLLKFYHYEVLILVVVEYGLGEGSQGPL